MTITDEAPPDVSTTAEATKSESSTPTSMRTPNGGSLSFDSNAFHFEDVHSAVVDVDLGSDSDVPEDNDEGAKGNFISRLFMKKKEATPLFTQPKSESNEHSLPEHLSGIDNASGKGRFIPHLACTNRTAYSIKVYIISGSLFFLLCMSLVYLNSLAKTSQPQPPATVRSNDPVVSTGAIATSMLHPELSFPSLPNTDDHINRLAFGTGSIQTNALEYWNTIHDYQPDLTILGGDFVHAKCSDNGCDELYQAYDDLVTQPMFVEASKALPIVATLDDQDYGGGEGSHQSNRHKDLARNVFLDFWGASDDDQRRTQKGGIYTSYEWGPLGERLQVILLDTRYARSKFNPTDKPGAQGKEEYIPFDEKDEKGKTMLGGSQWEWLKHQLDRPADVRLIVSSIQVLADGTGLECWRMIEDQRQKLYDWIAHPTGGGQTILLSGNRDMGGLYHHKELDLYEITSGSLSEEITATKKGCVYLNDCDEKDDMRLDDFVRVANFATVDVDWEMRSVTLGLNRAEDSSRTGNDAGELLQFVEVDIPNGDWF